MDTLSPQNAALARAHYRGVRACVARLHALALEMNDPHARAVLNSAALTLGTDKPPPAAPDAGTEHPKPAPSAEGVELLQKMKTGALLFLDGRNEHGSHVLLSLPQGLDVSNDTLVALDEQAEEIISAAEALGYQVGAHVWARFSWIREEYHHGYFEFSEIDVDVTRAFHAAFPGLDGNDPDTAIPAPSVTQAETVGEPVAACLKCGGLDLYCREGEPVMSCAICMTAREGLRSPWSRFALQPQTSSKGEV